MPLLGQIGESMVNEWFAHLRGYDKWTSTVATVQLATLSRVGEVGKGGSDSPVALGWESTCEIRWEDQNQIQHTAVFHAFEESPLYQLCEGDTVSILFNPAKPSEYYLPGLIRSELTRTWKLMAWTLMLLVLGIGFIVFLVAH
jgi:hypothetical protein